MKQMRLWFAVGALLLTVSAVAQTNLDYDALVQKGKTQLHAGTADLALASGETAIRTKADRWEGYALAGGALMNLKRYEEAVDKLSHAIDRAPEAKQPALRDLRRQCLLAESGIVSAEKKEPAAATTAQAEIVLWKSIEKSTDPADFQSYLAQYPQGAFVVLAQRHLAAVKQQAEQQAEYAQEKQRKQQDEERRTLTWKDPSTGLTWTKKPAHLDWNGANKYCATLRLFDYSWRLPTIDELIGISRPNVPHIKGDIDSVAPDGPEAWSSSLKSDHQNQALVFYFRIRSRDNSPADKHGKISGLVSHSLDVSLDVLCVHGSEK